MHALQAESWTGYTIKHAMKNRMTAANKAARAAAAAAPNGPWMRAARCESLREQSLGPWEFGYRFDPV